MSDLTSRLVNLREYMITNRVPLEVQQDSVEIMLGFYENHRAKTGSLKHLQGEEYFAAMKERLNYAYNKTVHYLNIKGYGDKTK